MKNNLEFLKKIVLLFLLTAGWSTLCATTYLSSASNGAAWTSTTTLDAYQNTANNFVGQSSSITYNPDNGDTLQGFFMFKNGFSSWTSGSLYWDARGIIDGAFSIPSGWAGLHLSSNLHLGPSATLSLSDFFAITGDGNTIFLEGNDVNLSRQCYLYNTLVIDGLGHKLTVSDGGYFNATGASSGLILSNTDLHITNTTQSVFQESITVTLRNSVVRACGNGNQVVLADSFFVGNPSGNYSISGDVRFEGFGQRINVAGRVTIKANSRLYVGPGVTMTNITRIKMTDQTSILHLDGCEFYTGSGGDGTDLTNSLTVTKGTLLLENKVKIFNRNYGYTGAANSNMSKALILGSGTPEDAVNVVVRAGAYVAVDGCIDYRAS